MSDGRSSHSYLLSYNVLAILLCLSSTVYSIDESSLEVLSNHDPNQNSPKSKFEGIDVSGVTRIHMEEDIPYRIRFDPPELCERVILCEEESKKCGDNSIMINMVDSIPSVYSSLEGYANATKLTEPIEILNGVITIGDVTHNVSRTLRVETSSFYCFAHIGDTKNDQVPEIEYLDNKNDEYFFPNRVNGGTSRSNKGMMFTYKTFNIIEIQRMDTKKYLEERCESFHDWNIDWPVYDDSALDPLTNGPFLVYHLDGMNSSCSNVDQRKSILIDFENPHTELAYDFGDGTCKSFSVCLSNENKPCNDPKSTFEFYPLLMIYLGPDRDDAREFRTDRDRVNKIRISFENSADLFTARVEYDFLNARVAGVSEVVTMEDFTGFEYASIIMDGHCNVRLLNDRPYNSGLQSTEQCVSIDECTVRMNTATIN